ncbi:unnamed protein product [Plutella xylostella]|uniref:(diamondback moth) hypothetical protein n=1 Tax=Plutella xylostella TaxID=51655 RepID=A0A8S4G8G6_PLUXY|nr:unnamed protein product [Plutella xylostella]
MRSALEKARQTETSVSRSSEESGSGGGGVDYASVRRLSLHEGQGRASQSAAAARDVRHGPDHINKRGKISAGGADAGRADGGWTIEISSVSVSYLLHRRVVSPAGVGQALRLQLPGGLVAGGAGGRAGEGEARGGAAGVKPYTGRRVANDSLRMVYHHDQTVAVVELGRGKLLLNCELIETIVTPWCFFYIVLEESAGAIVATKWLVPCGMTRGYNWSADAHVWVARGAHVTDRQTDHCRLDEDDTRRLLHQLSRINRPLQVSFPQMIKLMMQCQQISSRTDRSIFDLSRLRAKQKVTQTAIMDILYADDVCLMADAAESLQTYVDNLHSSCRKFGLVISTSKTQVLKQPARGCGKDHSDITLDSTALEEVSVFKYLGSRLRNDNTLASEIPARIAGAANAFGKLKSRVWNSRDLKLQTKLLVYKAIILPILLYAAETWCCYKADIKQLDTFHLKCLRSILRIKWQDRIPNTEVLRRSKLSGVESLIAKQQLRWSGHVLRMDDSRLPKAVFYSELSCGKRKQGGQYLRYKDVLKRNLVACNIPTKSWEERARSRPEWRHTVHTNVDRFEQKRLEDLDAKRQARKTRPKPSYNYTYNSSGQLYCTPCSRVFKTKFGFASHIRAHQNNNPD